MGGVVSTTEVKSEDARDGWHENVTLLDNYHFVEQITLLPSQVPLYLKMHGQLCLPQNQQFYVDSERASLICSQNVSESQKSFNHSMRLTVKH
jgi:hypothetical protein